MEKTITFKTEVKKDFVLVAFELTDILEPVHLKNLYPPDPVKENFASKGVVLSGRGPIWLYGFLVHYYHPVRWVATFDPRLNGAVVVESHHPGMEVGEILPLDNAG
jgi:CRISPR-associated protein Csx3